MTAANLEGIMAVYDILPKTPQVAVFDTGILLLHPGCKMEYEMLQNSISGHNSAATQWQDEHDSHQ